MNDTSMDFKGLSIFYMYDMYTVYIAHERYIRRKMNEKNRL